MRRRDKHRPRKLAPLRASMRAVLHLALLAFSLTALVGCNRMITPRGAQLVKDADARAAEGDFLRAVNLYESALDDTSKAAEIHYKLALLYDDRMKEPLNALHHFKRYLALAPNGSHANEARNFMKRDELALVTSLSGDSVVSRAEAARLKNENLSLRRDLEERSAQARFAVANDKATRGAQTEKAATPAKSGKSTPKSHVVITGDTLFSLSRKYYGSTDRWKEIRRANSRKLDSSGKLKVGQTLTLP